MPVIIDIQKPESYTSWSARSRKHYDDPENQYWRNVYQASDGQDLFVFETRYGNGVDSISDFGVDDKIRLIDFDGAFEDLAFEVDASHNVITIRYDDSDNQIILRNVADLVDDNGNHLLTSDNFHFVSKDPNGFYVSKSSDTGGPGVELDGDGLMRGGKGDDLLRSGKDDASWRDDDGKFYSNWAEGELRGRKGDDTLLGGMGNDKLYGGKGNDTLFGNWGNDQLYGGQGDDILKDVWGDDKLYGGKGDDHLDGGQGDDKLYGGRGHDILYGDWGDDVLRGGKDDDFLDGGRGSDTFVFYEGDGHDIVDDFGFGWSRRELDEYPLTYEGRQAAEAEALANGWTDKIQLHLDVAADTTDEAAFESLDIRQDGEDTVIGYGSAGDKITLKDVNVYEVTIDDFEFVFIG